ncbi:MAG: PPC domain-containing protein, partial [Caldilineaceae bacterium]|nr:PPC domain-containing protein [Caldilineaceae bacterium]
GVRSALAAPLVAEAQVLADEGQFDGAMRKLTEAAAIDATLDLDALTTEAQTHAAAALLGENRVAVAEALQATENVTVTVGLWQTALTWVEEDENPVEALRLCQLRAVAPEVAPVDRACASVMSWTPVITASGVVTGTVNDALGDLWTFTLDAASTVTITLSADRSEFDSYLTLYDPQFQLLDENDNSGDSRHSALNGLALTEPGSYWIEVRGYEGDTGAYRLSVTVAPEQ